MVGIDIVGGCRETLVMMKPEYGENENEANSVKQKRKPRPKYFMRPSTRAVNNYENEDADEASETEQSLTFNIRHGSRHKLIFILN